MSTLTYNDFSINQGASWLQSFVYKAGEPPVEVNLSGMSGFANIATYYGEEPVFRLTTENSGVIFGTGLGEISLLLNTGDTASLFPGKYVITVGLNNAGFIDFIVGGEITVSAGVI